MDVRDAAVALLSLDNPRGGDATSPRYDVFIKEGGAELEEADGRRDDVDFEGDRDAVVALLSLDDPGGGDATSPLNNVVIKEGGVRRQRRRTGGGTITTLRGMATTWGGARRRLC